MKTLPPQLVECPSITSVAGYYREGRKRLATAVAAHPEMDPCEALIRWHGLGKSIVGPSARKFYQEDVRALRHYLRISGRSDAFAELSERLKLAIDSRRRRKAKKRKDRYGAGKKETDATEAEAIAVFKELKRNALDLAYMTDVYAALFVLIVSHAGLRPIELIGAELVGTTLLVQNAKRKDGLPAIRGIELEGLPEDVQIGLGLMISIMPQFRSRAHYKAWAKDVAEALARACKRANIRRLSLYTFRHVALATWKKAGLSGAEIAALAGHLSERSAGHYASARHGHDRKSVARAATPAGIEKEAILPSARNAPQGHPAANGVEAITQSIWEEPPQPAARAVRPEAALSPEAVHDHFARLADAADPAGRDIGKATQTRPVVEDRSSRRKE